MTDPLGLFTFFAAAVVPLFGVVFLVLALEELTKL